MIIPQELRKRGAMANLLEVRVIMITVYGTHKSGLSLSVRYFLRIRPCRLIWRWRHVGKQISWLELNNKKFYTHITRSFVLYRTSSDSHV